MAKNKIANGVAYVVGFGAGIAASVCAGQAFEACVPAATTEIQEVVRKVGKWGCKITAHAVVSNEVKSYCDDILTAGEMSAEMLQGMVADKQKKA